MPNCGPSHRHFAKAHTSRRAPLRGRFLLIVPAPSGNVSRILIPGRNTGRRGGPTPPCRSVTFGPKSGYGNRKSLGIGVPPPSFRGTMREGEQESQVVWGLPRTKGTCVGGLGRNLGRPRWAAPRGGRHRHGRRSATGPPRPPLAGLWSLDQEMAAAEFGRVRLMSAPEKNHTSCCAMRTGTHVTGVPLNDCLGVLATPLYRTARLSLASR